MSNYEIEPDQDFSAAEAPEGFEFSPQGDTLNFVEADGFLPDVNEAVNGLLWLGYLTEEFELYGHRFAIKTLTRGEKLITSQITKRYEESLGLADAYQTAQVAASLVSVDGVPIVDLNPGADPYKRIHASFELVQKWFDPVLSSIFDRIAALNVRQQQAFLAFQSK